MQGKPAAQVQLHRSSSRTGVARAFSVFTQCGDGVELPESCDLEAMATRVYASITQRGLADDFLHRVALQAKDTAEVELCIRLVDAAEGEALNHEWRGKAAPTNVLSFPADVVVDDLAPLGDLVLCVAVVEKEASNQNKALGDHYSHLLVHGILHLLGYDHVAETEAKAMESMEVAVLSELGVQNPYLENPNE